MNTLTIQDSITLQPATQNKNSVSHLNQYNDWIQSSNQNLLYPDLISYRDHLLDRLSPNSTRVHLSHIRRAYQQLIQDRDLFYKLIPAEHADSISNQKAYVDEWITRIKSSINPDNCQVKTITIQDIEDDKHLRLTKEQASEYLNSFGTSDIKSLRNSSIVGLMLCTGIRESELIDLDIDDLRQSLGGDVSLRIKSGKGSKQRLIPYGQLSWILVLIDKYLSLSNITTGKIFPLSVRQIQNIVKSKPVNINGELKQVRPHDLRRTYAKLLYLEGMNMVAIKDNLGHSSIKTTERYIGILSSKDRQPTSIYSFDLSSL